MTKVIRSFQAVQRVWVDDSGKVNYIADSRGYIRLPDAIESDFERLHELYHMGIFSPQGERLGWVEDFLFDWNTGNIAAYIIGGNMAAPFGGRAVLYPEDVEVIDAEAVVVKEGAQLSRFEKESQGLQSFLSATSRTVENLVKTVSERFKSLFSPQGKSQVIRVKIKQEGNASNSLPKATNFLLSHWQSLTDKFQRALQAAWKELTK
ncbi:MAG: PRC-barrel domain-containing protein [Oscillatoriaceae bacterium SKW80]|nr:PRC-barrel domain-containing protein [Oscillatoriaceae bacterium SKYG93]MCX8120357.1 PRC-barrel domain-containing protein [Oscillatoriaceae bacterium SKW80]MDW8453283.1 PRC-barrel domain-containing protein [Oscillatoriaceae cyanobacterium SKYGB_i_bin93]HIK27275.1 PRC-barrel domain-containing protein [Oscillatoriaceae cyanobacterium M7585_C2015_266]